ncbi:MAG: helix-turn-helix transcriptional regulator [Clostridia bacterium]|nr:helix-turn-helix transcriptional regulator [Clostridia bacterium]
MKISSILKKKKMTKYQLAKVSHVPYATLNDILSGKTKITKCSAETLYKLAKALEVSMESLIETEIKRAQQQRERERSYEYGLPTYLQHDLDMYKKGLEDNSSLLDCLWGELYGSINMAEISEGSISAEHANYLRQKYLWR